MFIPLKMVSIGINPYQYLRTDLHQLLGRSAIKCARLSSISLILSVNKEAKICPCGHHLPGLEKPPFFVANADCLQDVYIYMQLYIVCLQTYKNSGLTFIEPHVNHLSCGFVPFFGTQFWRFQQI